MSVLCVRWSCLCCQPRGALPQQKYQIYLVMENSAVVILAPFEEYKHILKYRQSSAKRESSLGDSATYHERQKSALLPKTKLPSSICSTLISGPSDRLSICSRQPLRKGLTNKQFLNVKMNQKLEQIKRTCLRMKEHTSVRGESDDESIAESIDLDVQKEPTRVKCFIRKSKYLNRPSTVHFDYPKCCNLQNIHNANEVVPLEGSPELKYRLTGHEYKCIINALEHNGFTRTYSSRDWNVYFDVACRELRALAQMNRFQKISHFPGCWFLGRKDYMWKVLQKMRRRFPAEYDFIPYTYLFPTDFQRFETVREGASKEHLWIMKPAGQACGRGIKIITKQTKIKPKKDYLVSEYVKNPHLINGLKYDLRIYVAVVSYDPLKIYMFDEGLARFATHKYSTKLKEVKKRFIHLTNFSVNKKSKMFVKDQGDGKGSKWSLTVLREYYRSQGIDDELLFAKIKDVIVKTCISAESSMLDIHSKSHERRTCGFQLYGFDVLIDQNLKPWLMEVNVCPSLSSSSPMDRRLKHTLMVDLLNLIGLEIFDRKKYEEDKKKQKERILTGQSQKKSFFSKNINNLTKLTYDNCVEILSPEDWLLLFELEEEQSRRGHFELLFPVRQTMSRYMDLFEFPRYNNMIVWQWLNSPRNFLEHLK